jgi:hypothetical protein
MTNLQSNVESTIQRFMDLQKAAAGISTGTGLTFYDLEARAKFQYPVLAPIRQRMPRIGATNPMGGQGLAAHWNSITNPNAGSVPAEASEGQSGALLTPTVTPKVAFYKLLALDGNVTWFAEWAGYGYEDVRSAQQRMSLDSMILAEEPRLLWGNSGTAGVGLQFGTPAQPTGVGSGTNGYIPSTANLYIAVAALSHQGWVLANAPAVSGGGGGVAAVPTYTKYNGDGTTLQFPGGVSQVSPISAAITGCSAAAGTGSVTAKVTAIPGAAAYIWYMGSTNALGSCYFSQITTINYAVLTTLNTTGQTAAFTGSTTDNSYNPYAFDGLITQAISGGGYYASYDGAAMHSDNAGGVVEINTALKYFWDNFKTSPTCIYAGSGTINSLTVIMLSAAAAATAFEYRVGVSNTPGDVGNLVGAAFVGSYNNRFALGARKPIPIVLHPNMPDGHIMFDLEVNPYPNSNIPYARAVRTLRDYFQVLWPATTASWRNTIFSAEVLQCYVPYGMGLISNVQNS